MNASDRPRHRLLRITKTMTSLKCRNCGLVNFSTEVSCKRCRTPLPGDGTQQFQSFHNPPPPPVFDGDTVEKYDSTPSQSFPCIKCGNRQNISVQNFVKVYYSPVAFLGIPLGILTYFILKWLLSTKHDLAGPFCALCWARFQNAESYRTVNTLLFFPLLIAGIVFAFYVDNVLVLLAALLVPLFVLTGVGYFLNTYGPKYKRVNSREVVIDAPHVGEILYAK